jgi:outer membrane protein assembly factor BamB
VFALDGDGRRLWTTQLEGGDISKAAAVLTAPGEPERVIVSAGERVHALDAATGAVVWAVTPSGRPLSAPAIGDPHILVADDAGTLFSLDPRRGTVLSSFPGRGPVAIGDPNSSGPEVFVSDGGVFAQKEVDATPIWKAALGGQSGPLAVAGGVVLATPEPRDGAPRIVALDAATGRELGDAELPAGTSSAPALIGGRVVVATRRGDLVAYEGPDS